MPPWQTVRSQKKPASNLTPTGFHDHLTIDTGALDKIDTLWLAKS